MDDELPPRRLPQFTVVHKPRVAVRASAAVSANMIGTKTTGAVVTCKKISDGWIELDGEPGFMLIDGASIKLGLLLERVPVPDASLTLKFSHPTTGKPLHDLPTTMSATIKEVKMAVAAATGLKATAMCDAHRSNPPGNCLPTHARAQRDGHFCRVLARGRMGGQTSEALVGRGGGVPSTT